MRLPRQLRNAVRLKRTTATNRERTAALWSKVV
jgi:hypothetical protein